MDLTEILSYKPVTAAKRSRNSNDDDDEDGLPPSKSMKSSDDGKGNELTYEEKLQLLQSIDEQDEVVTDLDVTAIKRMLLGFEKQVLKNQEMRVKFPNQPEKFMESELELNEEIQRLHVISTVPQFYGVIIEVNIIQTLIGLLSHDNSDISIAIVDLLQQLTDADIEDDEGAESDDERGGVKNMELLIDSLLQEQLIPLLVQNMDRLDEKVKEDSDGVHMTLAIIENMCEYRNEEVAKSAGEQGMMTWLLKRVRVRQYDPNKLYASEILAILLQDNESNQRLLGEVEGIDILLQSLAYYKKRDPHSTDEVELMENLFDCLCSSLMYNPNRDRFLKGEGLQLMRLMLQGKKLSRCSALKVLNHAMCNAEGKDNCVKFVEIFGLGSLFPAFMKVPKSSRKSISLTREHEEHVTSIIASLLRNTSGPGKDRIISKFLENDHEKVDRLVELHLQYLDQVQQVDTDIDNDLLLRRLDAGLFTLQQVDYIITELCVSGVQSIKSRINSILSIRGETLESVKDIMKEYYQQLTEAAKPSKDGEEWLKRLNTMTNEIL